MPRFEMDSCRKTAPKNDDAPVMSSENLSTGNPFPKERRILPRNPFAMAFPLPQIILLTMLYFFGFCFPNVAADVDCEYSYSNLFGTRQTVKFECNDWDYCCGDACCHSSGHFWRLWYFWFVIALICLMCLSSCFWCRRRMLQRRAQTTTIIGSVPNANYVPAYTAPGVYVTSPQTTTYPYAAYHPGAGGSVTVVSYPQAQATAPVHVPSPVPQPAVYPAPPPAYNELYK